MTAPLSCPDLVTAALASLSAARSAEDLDVRTFYAAAARSAVEQLDEHVRKLRLNLGQVEAELVKLTPKKMVGAERT
jgi:hypothetical protein